MSPARLTITRESSVEELTQLYRREKHPKIRLLLLMVLSILEGASATQVATEQHCHPSTVCLWIHRYNALGAAGLGDQPRSGRPLNISAEQLHVLLAQPPQTYTGRIS